MEMTKHRPASSVPADSEGNQKATRKGRKDGQSGRRKSGDESIGAAKPVTLATISRELGVSRMTVSYALREDGSASRLSKETVRRVRDAAKRLNYVPNELARQLRQTRTRVVGVVVPDLRRDWADRVLAGMQPVFDAADYLPLLMTHRWDLGRAVADVRSLLRRRVDGLIVFPVKGLMRQVAGLVPESTPLMLLGDASDDLPAAMHERVCRVMWDAGPAAAVAADHLLDEGCRHIVFAGSDPQSLMSRTRFDGFATALRNRGVDVDERCVLWDDRFEIDALADQLLTLLADPGRAGPVDGIFAMNDSIAADLLLRLRLAGYRLPHDLKLVGMGDLPIAGEDAIGLTTVGEPCEAIGREAAQVVLDALHGLRRRAAVTLVPGSNLHVRRTTVAARRASDRFNRVPSPERK